MQLSKLVNFHFVLFSFQQLNPVMNMGHVVDHYDPLRHAVLITSVSSIHVASNTPLSSRILYWQVSSRF